MKRIQQDEWPLYVQVKQALLEKIKNQEWSPGELIPTETQLAKSLGVSLGTIRKAVTDLSQNNILEKKQGLGTFVKSHNPNRALFHFFHIEHTDGEKVIPLSSVISLEKRKATKHEAATLQLKSNAQIIYIERTRELKNQIIILEEIILSYAVFSKLLKVDATKLPNTLYELYEKQFNVTIHRASEKISAIAANTREAKYLRVYEGYPLLKIERLALTLDNTPAEIRISKCNTKDYHYSNIIF